MPLVAKRYKRHTRNQTKVEEEMKVVKMGQVDSKIPDIKFISFSFDVLEGKK